MLVNFFQNWPLLIVATPASKESPDINLKEVRPRRPKELLDVIQALALGLRDEEEAEEEGEDGDASKHPKGASLGQTHLLQTITVITIALHLYHHL